MSDLVWHTEKRRVKDLMPWDMNPRFLSEKTEKDLTESLTRFNLMSIPVVDTDNIIVSGHQRIFILKKLGRIEEEIDVRIPNRKLAPDEFAEANLRENKNVGDWDFDMLANFDEKLLLQVGFDPKELDRIFEIEPEEKDDKVPDERATTDIVLGDLFQLGEHRLLCGDSTNAEHIDKLMGGERAVLALTDPPYSVNYKSRKEHTTETMDSYQDPSDAGKLLEGFMSVMPTDMLVMSYADKQLHPYVLTCEKLGFETIDLLIWVKQNFCFWMGARYQQKHELIFLCRRKGKKSIDNVPSNVSTIIECDRQMKNDIHPTQKPLKIFEDLCNYHSNRGDIVYEPFCGSGTTLLACEKNARKCRAIEISPLFCQVIIDRWEEFTKQKAVKL